MRRISFLLSALFLGLSGFAASGARTQVRLLLSHAEARAGETVTAAIELRMPPHVHTYWRNPGESGMLTTIEWVLPEGISAGPIQWPVPEKFEVGGITTYGYHGEILLLVPLKLAPDLKPGSLELNAKVSWLECEELCVPGNANVKATLAVGDESKPSTHVELLDAAKARLPKDGSALSASGAWERTGSGDSRPLIITWNTSGRLESADFLPYSSTTFDVAPATEMLPSEPGKPRLRKSVTKLGADWPESIPGVLSWKTRSETEPHAYEVALDVTSPAQAAQVAARFPNLGLLVQKLFLAFLGGLILNVMPCVFPVIALKILGFVQQSKEAPRQVFRLGLIYALGVVASFLVLAGTVVAVQRAGGAASWGMQMQNPQFTLLLTVLITLVALNLFGVFEVTLGGRAMGVAGQLASRQGAAGAFLNGVLATALATPCTAPFLAPALGFAFAQPPAVIVAMFVAVALGLAFPYIVLSWQPQWLRFLPRPGPWMERFKVVMGFPMLATAVWLFSFTARRFGGGGPLWLGLFLVVLALSAWIWGQFVQRGRKGRAIAACLSLLLLASGYGYALEKELHWRSPVKHAQAGTPAQGGVDVAAWQKWSPEAVEKARAEGRPVLVDFTADWCLTCKYNKRFALDTADVRARIKQINAATLVGDNTDEDPAIVAELNKFDRAGVPLVLVYPRDRNQPPIVLPALLTKRIVLDALDRAAK